ncbi:hypothetical protein LENED_008038 [Lentinula edodes]|uniref:Uncharacterized protein n=1 Tax=Lentinula edodes TaxID=5353 RepID=A0A1Q3EG51_LENED|nr:hypothetical protein LENED_008038 [Lentinula edodes]
MEVEERENSSLTSALRDTSHALESRQREVEQLRSSSQEFLQRQEEYRRIIDQFNTLDRALSGPSDQSLLERFQKVEEELRITKKDRDDATGKLSTSSRRISELTTALLYQHGITEEKGRLETPAHDREQGTGGWEPPEGEDTWTIGASRDCSTFASTDDSGTGPVDDMGTGGSGTGSGVSVMWCM